MATYSNLNFARLGDQALQSFIKELLPLNVFSRVYNPNPMDSASRGNVVMVPLIGTLTGTTFGGTYAISAGTQTGVTVTINRHKVVHVGQRDIDALDNSNAALENFFYQQGGALAQTVLEDILTLATTSNYASVTAVGSTVLDVPQLRKARLALNQDNITRRGPRSVLIDSVGMDALLAVTNFVQAYMYKDQSVLQEGRIVRALGMDFFELNASFLPTTNSVNAFVAHPAAVAIAMRYVQPQRPEEYTFADQFSDPVTGATFGMRDVYDPLTGQRYIALECNYGYSVGITNAGRLIKRTD